MQTRHTATPPECQLINVISSSPFNSVGPYLVVGFICR